MWLRIVTNVGPVLLNSAAIEDISIHERNNQFLVAFYAARANGQECWIVPCETKQDAERVFELVADRLAAGNIWCPPTPTP